MNVFKSVFFREEFSEREVEQVVAEVSEFVIQSEALRRLNEVHSDCFRYGVG